MINGIIMNECCSDWSYDGPKINMDINDDK
jgi:hypothetical protein